MQIILTSRIWHKAHFPASLCMCWSVLLSLRRTKSCRRYQWDIERGTLCTAAAGCVQGGTDVCTSWRAELSAHVFFCRCYQGSKHGASQQSHLQSCSPACAWQSRAPSAALRGRRSSEAVVAAGLGAPAEDACMPSGELSPAGRAGCQHPAWDSAGATVQAELAAGGGEETLQASSSMSVSLNCKLACKYRLSAPTAAW